MSKSRYILVRLLQTIPLLAGILLLVMLLLHVVPGDPARAIGGITASEETVEQIRKELGLDRSLPAQYFAYLGNTLRGDLGKSTRSRQPVTKIIADRLAPTILLLTFGILMSIAIAALLSIVAARNKDGWSDCLIGAVTVSGLSMPAYWVGIILLILIALPTGWFPISGIGNGLAGILNSLFLPALTFAFAIAPVMIRALRARFISLYSEDFVTMSRAAGLSEDRILFGHLSRHAALILLTMISVQIGPMIFVSVVIEKTFALPGLGQALVNAVSQRDFPVIQGITLVTALFVTTVHLSVDIISSYLNPRMELR